MYLIIASVDTANAITKLDKYAKLKVTNVSSVDKYDSNSNSKDEVTTTYSDGNTETFSSNFDTEIESLNIK